MNKEII